MALGMRNLWAKSRVSSTVNIQSIGTSSFTLNAGPLSMTLSANGAGSVTFKEGIASGTIGYEVSGSTVSVTSAAITLGMSYGANLAGANITLTQTNGQWSGTAVVGITVKSSVDLPVVGTFNIPGASWINNNLSSGVISFNPSTQNPCTLLGNSTLASTCAILQAGGQTGSINVNEQKALQDLGLSGETFTPFTDGAGNSILFGNLGTILTMNPAQTGVVFSPTANGQGQIYADYNASDAITDAFISGQGVIQNLSSIPINVAPSSAITINGSANTINAGAGTAVTTGGNGATGIADTVNELGVGTVSVESNSAINVNGTGDTVTAGTGDSFGVHGNNDSVSANIGDGVWIGNGGAVVTGDSVIVSGATVTFGANTQGNIFGNNDGIILATSDSLSANGCTNTINSGATNLVSIGVTNGYFDLINSTGDATGGTTASGQATGIYLAANSQANVSGSNNGITLVTGDSMGAYGGGNTINVGANDAAVVGNTKGNADIVNAWNDPVGQTTANGQGSGVYLAPSSEATVNGFNSDIVETGSDITKVYGSGDITDAENATNVTTNYAPNDYTNAYGLYDTTNNYGPSDFTNNFGGDERTNDYGTSETGYNGTSGSNVTYSAYPGSDTLATIPILAGDPGAGTPPPDGGGDDGDGGGDGSGGDLPAVQPTLIAPPRLNAARRDGYEISARNSSSADQLVQAMASFGAPSAVHTDVLAANHPFMRAPLLAVSH
jgi:hypothetical protein